MTQPKKTRAKRPQVAPPAVENGPGGKLGMGTAMFRRPEGATLEQMQAATGWLRHAVRGLIAGAVKKNRGLAVVSEKTDGGRVYRIAPAANS